MNTMSDIASLTRMYTCSGAMVESMLHNLKVEDSRPACARIFFPLHRRKIPAAPKTQQKIQAQMEKQLSSMYESSLRHPVWVPKINVTACNRALIPVDSLAELLFPIGSLV